MTDLVLHDKHVPSAFRRTRLADFDPARHPGGKRVGRAILRAVDQWEPSDAKPGLLMQGGPNLGKTMLSSALLNEYHDGWQPNRPLPDAALLMLLQEKCPVYFVQLAELIQMQIRRFQLRTDVERGIREPEEYLDLDRLLEDLKYRVKVLVVDDVGKEHRTGSNYAVDEFDLLVRTRYNNGFTTIFTTNVPLNRWSAQYSESMQSLIERASLVVTFD